MRDPEVNSMPTKTGNENSGISQRSPVRNILVPCVEDTLQEPKDSERKNIRALFSGGCKQGREKSGASLELPLVLHRPGSPHGFILV